MGKNREVIQQEKRAIYTLVKSVEEFPQYSLVQHIIHFLRTKGDGTDPYHWSSDETLKKVEKYYDELLTDLANGED